jgi:hypothetical protein
MLKKINEQSSNDLAKTFTDGHKRNVSEIAPKIKKRNETIKNLHTLTDDYDEGLDLDQMIIK